MQFEPLMVWPGLVPVRPAKACALFPPFEAEVLLLRRERERESHRVPPPDVEQHTHWGQSLSKCGRSNIETIFQHSRQQTNGRKSLTHVQTPLLRLYSQSCVTHSISHSFRQGLPTFDLRQWCQKTRFSKSLHFTMVKLAKFVDVKV